GGVLNGFSPGATDRSPGASEACRLAVASYLAASWHQQNLPKHDQLAAKVDRLSVAFKELQSALDALDKNDFHLLESAFRMDRAEDFRNPLFDTTPEAHLARFRARAREFAQRVPEVFEALPATVKPEPSQSVTPTPNHMPYPFDDFVADMARVAEDIGIAVSAAKSMPYSRPSPFVRLVRATLKAFHGDVAAIDMDELQQVRVEQYSGFSERAARRLWEGEVEAQKFALMVLPRHMETDMAASNAISRALTRNRPSQDGVK
ncbi:MAG: hypothetical protein VX463_14595, partial [Pseudomonadota bacterium]|nr:hypothetical protein [Pseudomonadota bacterium]